MRRGQESPGAGPRQWCQLCAPNGESTPATATVAGVRLCERHEQLARAIARDAGE